MSEPDERRREAERVAAEIARLIAEAPPVAVELAPLVALARKSDDWRELGYPSWKIYVANEFGPQLDHRPADQVPADVRFWLLSKPVSGDAYAILAFLREAEGMFAVFDDVPLEYTDYTDMLAIASSDGVHGFYGPGKMDYTMTCVDGVYQLTLDEHEGR